MLCHLSNFRQALNEAKKQNHNLMERVQGVQNDLSDSDVRRAELDGQLRTSHNVSSHSRGSAWGAIFNLLEDRVFPFTEVQIRRSI